MQNIREQLTGLHILIVDDEADIRLGLTRLLSSAGASISSAASGEEALAAIETAPVDLVISDIRMSGISGMEVLRRIKSEYPAIEVILVTGFGTIEIAVESLQAGAANFLTKPFDNQDILNIVSIIGKRITAMRVVAANTGNEDGIIAVDPGTLQVLELVRQVAATHVPVLITGESGTGKELVARAIHRHSGMKKKLIAVNCAALPDSLLEAELFGFRRGAFTGADRHHDGLLQKADDSTLFLDEIASMSPVFQSKLLRVLQDKTIRPLGSEKSETTNFRLISASNQDLRDLVQTGEFREDLYYRLSVFPVNIPPLRERPQDILPLALHFVQRAAALCLPEGMDTPEITEEAVAVLKEYAWPGNIRELENAAQRAVILAKGESLYSHHFFLNSQSGTQQYKELPGESYEQAKQRLLDGFQRQFIENILERTGGNISQAAEECGLTRAAIQKIMRRLNINREQFGKRGKG